MEAYGFDDEWRSKALAHVAYLNDGGIGARMPYAELIIAADQLTAEGYLTRKDNGDRWITDAGRELLARHPTTGGEE